MLKNFFGQLIDFRKPFHWLVLSIAIFGSFRLHWAALINSQDFSVYWSAVHQWILGAMPYSFTSENQGFVFKYPPWMLAMFFPLGWFSFEWARSLWVLFQIFFIYFAICWAISHGVSRKAAVWTTAGFWWIWLAHASAGQVTILLMAGCLWACSTFAEKGYFFRRSFLLLLLSSKIFTLFSIVGMGKKIWNKSILLITIGLLLLGNGIVLSRLQGVETSLGGIDGYFQKSFLLYEGWVKAAVSGGSELGVEVVRGQGNHGFTAGILRLFSVDSHLVYFDILVTCILGILFSIIWIKTTANLTFVEKWVGWIALGLIIHPLAWHHSFVLAYPLCAVSLDRSLRTSNLKLILLALFGMSCIGLLIPQTIGKVWVKPLELVSVKSWGVVFSALALVLSKSQKNNMSITTPNSNAVAI